jgi:hypothetical protein
LAFGSCLKIISRDKNQDGNPELSALVRPESGAGIT